MKKWFVNVRDAVGQTVFRPLRKPFFIVGTGRSGTTILGTALARHPAITYLNEPRELWALCYPQTDIWSQDASQRGGKLVLQSSDAAKGDARRVRWLFRYATLRSGRPILVEKLPFNSFRIPWLRQIFPEARFIHIRRNGIDVARSIAKLADAGRWFGHQEYKWSQLVEYAGEDPNTADLPQLCTDNFDRGLLEWRLSTDAIIRHLRECLDDHIEIAYESFVESPVETITAVLSFIGVDADPAVDAFVRSSVERRAQPSMPVTMSPHHTRIAGLEIRNDGS